ncbi:DnaT-like ssDNA-binding protein [Xanthobacter tagetidis]|uniref:Putative DnaT-like domain-containing protein n=1 Tax=Xanthobacter tagetidis TaxID=60216 RepID=A0A3L7AH50_9HYPH|nr:DnaT-like ssDNA-binding protein [Xanthobacter tagetidis]MBB6306225.1 hypothetical protein [Xanthobacter tagetidis]RLP79507.1 hypothetical protein D9R14_07530 [Xanthobacter tagetidis]
MALVVETGEGLGGAESYVSVADCAAFASARGLTFPASPEASAEAALRRATAWVDATYRSRFPGQRRRQRDQALEWPRIDACDREGYAIDYDSVPSEIVIATCEAAVRELAVPGSMAPDLERGGAIKRVKAGSVEVEYSGAADATTTFSVVDNALGPILRRATPFTARAVRG